MRLVRRRARAAALAAAAALGLAGCGGSADPSGPLGWKADPVLQVADNLPDDRILTGTVRNTSIREELDIDAAKVEVRDGKGRRLEAFAAFTFAFAHGLYGASETPNGPVDSDRERLGLRRRLKPGQESALTVAFRVSDAAEPPFVVDYGPGELAVPASP